MPSIKPGQFEGASIAVLGAWALVSIVQGSALSMFVSADDSYNATMFIGLVYDSVFAGVLITLFSSRLASAVCGIAALLAGGILFKTNAFGHSWPTGKSLLEAIVIRPALAAIFLLLLPSVGPLGGQFVQLRDKQRKAG